MAITATVLFNTPQREVASTIRNKLASAISIQIVVGFATVEGVAALEQPISNNPGAIQTLIVGAGTYRAYEAFDRLIALGVVPDRLFVHLGHTRTTGAAAKHRFYRYHPMLHSKIYYLEHSDGSASVLVGSHNATGFALMGLNGEAAILLEGPKESIEFQKIRDHINAAKSQSVVYSPAMKDALSWWTHQFMEGLADKANDAPREGVAKRTIVIICESKSAKLPERNDILYFELCSALGTIQSLRAEIHVYVFDTLPPSPVAALQMLGQARASFWCRTQGLEMERGGRELLAQWYIDDDRRPILKEASKPFRPQPSSDMQQVRVKVYNDVRGAFEYLFDAPSAGWVPKLDEREEAQAPADYQEQLSSLDLVPPEHLPWFLVRGLVPADREENNSYYQALAEMSPTAGSFVLMSLRRRERETH
jgi:HKD family nuclease